MTERDRLFVLNDPHRMTLSKELAAEIGLMESIIVLQFEFLLSHTQIVRRGKPWIKATMEELVRDHFEWSSPATVWRKLERLQHQLKLVIAENFSTTSFDKTQYFTLNMRNVEKLKSVRVFQNETGGSFQNETGSVFQDETSQVNGTELQVGNSKSFQNETAPVFQNETPVSNRDADFAICEHRDHQNETHIGRDLQARDLKASPKGSQSDLADRSDEKATPKPKDNGPAAHEILTLALVAGQKYHSAFRGALARELREALDENFDYHVVAEAARRLVRRHNQEPTKVRPQSLYLFVQEVQNGFVPRNGNGHQTFDASSQDYARVEFS